MPSAPGPVFVLTAPGIPGGATQKIVFQQLVEIISEIDPAPPATSAAPGAPATHTKLPYGQTLPPKVTLKRGLDGDTTLWQWHQLALDGNPGALQNAALAMYAASDYASGKPPVVTWELANAWCTKIDVSGAGTGNGAVTETIELVCDRITAMRPVVPMGA